MSVLFDKTIKFRRVR